VPCRHWNVGTTTFNEIRSEARSQWRFFISTVTCSCLAAPKMRRALAFKTECSFCSSWIGRSTRVALPYVPGLAASACELHKNPKVKRSNEINRTVLATRRRTPERKHASVDAKLLRPSVDTALMEKMPITGRMLETRAAALSHCAIMYENRRQGVPTRRARAGPRSKRTAGEKTSLRNDRRR
jgi:hypothetical protein